MHIELLALSKDLVVALESGDEQNANALVAQIAGVRENLLFHEIGQLTRQLHDTMANFSIDSSIADLAEKDIPDAKERLQYVIAMTEQAANQTLNVVEDLLPLSEQLESQATGLAEKWQRFLDRELSFEEFKAMSQEMSQHFEYSNTALPSIQSGLNDILMAQGFQDITGQIIRRVITLVQDVENSLVKTIRHSGLALVDKPSSVTDLELPGPIVPGVDDKEQDVATNQVDVDDLLSSLGF